MSKLINESEFRGDPHNFGKEVHLFDENNLFKPRPILWEWLFLCRDSPLRLLFNEIKLDHFDVFECFPNLNFENSNDFQFGLVERLRLNKIISPPKTLAATVGNFVALMAWFGIGDLHRQNIGIGLNPETNALILCPLDIESIFEDFYLMSETALVTPQGNDKRKAGLFNLLELFQDSEPAEFIFDLLDSFVVTMKHLDSNEDKILKVFFDLKQLSYTPIRVIPRSTQDYRDCLDNNMPLSEPDIFHSEKVQIERKDIPYFFRYIANSQIFYYDTKISHAMSDITHSINLFKISSHRYLINSKKSEPKNKALLIKSGILQLARFFLDEKGDLIETKNEIMISKTNELLQINFKSEFKIQCNLD